MRSVALIILCMALVSVLWYSLLVYLMSGLLSVGLGWQMATIGQALFAGLVILILRLVVK